MPDVQHVRPRRGRPPKSEAGPTRELLLDAALELFAERGFVGTTVRQIARAVGVTDAAIYVHFASKQALFDALMEEAGIALLDRLGADAGALSNQHPAEVIPDTFARLVEAWDQPRVRLFTSVLLRHAPERIGEAISQAHDRLRPLVQAWVALGWLRDEVSAELLSFELLAPLVTIRLSLLHSRASETDRDRAHEMARQHLAFYVQTNVRDR